MLKDGGYKSRFEQIWMIHWSAINYLSLMISYTMRPLSVDKLNIVISRFHSNQTIHPMSSSTGVSTGTTSKIYCEHSSDLPKSTGSCPVKLSPANIHHAVKQLTTSEKVETVVQVSKVL